jgi:hypothetical protein
VDQVDRYYKGCYDIFLEILKASSDKREKEPEKIEEGKKRWR